MKKIIFYSYPQSSTCRKTSKCSDLNNIDYQSIDIVKEPPLKILVKLVLEKFSLEITNIFNIKGKIFKSLNLNIFDLTKKKIIELLSNDGKLIKRPFLIINESKLILGFKESEYIAIFN